MLFAVFINGFAGRLQLQVGPTARIKFSGEDACDEGTRHVGTVAVVLQAGVDNPVGFRVPDEDFLPCNVCFLLGGSRPADMAVPTEIFKFLLMQIEASLLS